MIEDGDRVSWRSTRQNKKGIRQRTGTVIKVYGVGNYALVKPDKGQGDYQYIALARLRKIKEQEKA